MRMNPYTKAERKAIKDVLKHQIKLTTSKTLISDHTELVILLNGTGKRRISRTFQPGTGGHMTEVMKNAAQHHNGCRIIHNHPSGGSLSKYDWNVLANHPKMEMTVVNSFGTTFRGTVLNPKAFLCWEKAIGCAEEKISNLLNAQVRTWSKQQKWDLVDQVTDHEWAIGWAIGDRLKEKGYANFKCTPNGGQIGVIHSAYQSVLNQAAMSAIP